MDPLSRLSSNNARLQRLEVVSVKAEIEVRMVAIRKLEAEVKRYQALLSPFRGFPMEILGEVFTAVLASIDKPRDIDIPSALKSLSLVCKTWRAAALATPQLWNTVGVDLCHGPVNFNKVKEWFTRSGTTSKSLTLDSGSVCAYHNSGCLLLDDGLVDLLTTGPSIRRLTINSQSSECFQWLSKALASPDSETPPSGVHTRLIELNSSELGLAPHFVGVEDTLTPSRYPFPTTLNLDLPLTQGDIQAANGNAYMQMLLATLTNLTLNFVWPTTWDQGILPLCTNLHMLTLKLNFDRDWIQQNWANQHPFVPERGCLNFPNLHTLRFEEHPGQIGWDLAILCLFKTPALVKLDVDFYDNDFTPYHRDELGDEIASLIKRSSCDATFTRLRIANISIIDESLQYILSHLPCVTHLTLDCVSFSSSFFQLPGVPSILPHLEVLELYGMYEAFGYQGVCDFAFSRSLYQDSVQKLRKLAVELSPNWSQDLHDTDDVKNLRKRGIDACIKINTYQ